MFEAMLEGWATQQRARFLKDNTIGPRLELVRRFAVFTNQGWRVAGSRHLCLVTSVPGLDTAGALRVLAMARADHGRALREVATAARGPRPPAT